MENSNRLPWIVAFSSLCFALGVLLTVFLMRPSGPGQAVQTVDVERTPSHGTGSRAGGTVPPAGGTPADGEAASGVPSSATPRPAATPSPTPSPPVPDSAAFTRQAGYHFAGLVTDMQGNPIPGAAVQFVLEQRGSQVKVELRTDAEGRFESRNLAGARVSGVAAEATGYARSEPLPPFDLPMEGLEIALKRQAVAEVRILDARGNAEVPTPFAGEATVYLLREGSTAGSTVTLGIEESAVAPGAFVAVASDQTVIRDGRYPLKDLEAGTYKAAVSVRGEPYTESEPFEVTAAEGGQGTIVIGLRQELVGFVKTDPEQQPVEGARVTLAAVGRPAVVGTPEPYRATTGSDGRFTLSDVAPGQYRLTLEAAGFTTKTLNSIPVVAGPPPAPATFFLMRTQPRLTVIVTGPENRPLRNAPLALISSGPGAQPRSFFARTDQTGSYEFSAVPSGRYSLAVNDPHDRTRQKMREIVLAETEDHVVERVAFAPTVEVEGKVKRKGKAFEGLLSILPRGQVAPEIFVKTESDGTYEVDLEPGEYMVGEARQEGRVLLTVRPVDSQTADLELP